MSYTLIFATLIVGLSGIVAQALLLRELLVSFYGNELTLGIVLANWVLGEALGVYLAGKLSEWLKNKLSLFIFLEVAFALMLPASVYLARTFKGILGIPFAEAVGLYTVFGVSLGVVFPAAFAHGALFSASAKLYSLCGNNPAQGAGRVYAWETIGTLLGGAIFTYLFIPFLNSFQIAFLISGINFLLLLVFSRFFARARSRYVNLCVLTLLVLLFIGVGPQRLQRASIERQWRGQGLLDYRNSIYGNIAMTLKQGQETIFYNGLPVITTPYPDITFVEEFAHLPLLFHPQPRKALVLSGGAGGLIREILKHPVGQIDYAELDPLLIRMLEIHPSPLTAQELLDPQVKIVNSDARLFLRRASGRYDVILIGVSRPADLSTNRLFTREFFALAKSRLNSEGMLALYLPGSLSYLSKELRDLNACVLNSLKTTFSQVKIIPGDYNLLFATDAGYLKEVNAPELAAKLKALGISTNLLTPAYLAYRLDPKLLDWFTRSSAAATRKQNQDLRPLAVFQMLLLWNKEFSPGLAKALAGLEGLGLKIILVCVAIITAFCGLVFRRRSRLVLAYCLATSGFFGMLTNLLLIFSFQVFYGYLYYMLGLLTAIFMAGIAAASIWITGSLGRIKDPRKLLLRTEFVIVLFTLFLAGILTRFGTAMNAYVFFVPLFFICGTLLGLEFPLASRLYIGKREEVGSATGVLYAADLLGGWAAGILGGIVFLPILGLLNTCLVIVLLKVSSILLLAINRRAV
jgi:spermidine synthase